MVVNNGRKHNTMTGVTIPIMMSSNQENNALMLVLVHVKYSITVVLLLLWQIVIGTGRILVICSLLQAAMM